MERPMALTKLESQVLHCVCVFCFLCDSQLRPEPLIEEIVQDCFLVHTHLPLERAVPGAVTFQLPAGGDATGTTSYRLEYTYAGADRGFGLHLFVLKSGNCFASLHLSTLSVTGDDVDQLH